MSIKFEGQDRRQAKLNKIDLINTWIPLHMNFPRGMLELNNEHYVDRVLKEAKSVFKNFNANAICDLFTYTLKDLNNTNIYNRFSTDENYKNNFNTFKTLYCPYVDVASDDVFKTITVNFRENTI